MFVYSTASELQRHDKPSPELWRDFTFECYPAYALSIIFHIYTKTQENTLHAFEMCFSYAF